LGLFGGEDWGETLTGSAAAAEAGVLGVLHAAGMPCREALPATPA